MPAYIPQVCIFSPLSLGYGSWEIQVETMEL